MNSESMIGKDFDNIVQRVTYGVLASRPDFAPCSDGEMPVESQRQMYDFLADIGCGVYSHPELAGITPSPDDAYGDNQVNNRKPELIKLMRKARKGVIKLYTLLCDIGVHGLVDGDSLRVATSDVRIAKRSLETLETFGITNQKHRELIVLQSEKYPLIFPAWRFLSGLCTESESDTIFLFTRGMFNPQPGHLIGMLAAFDPASHNLIVDLDSHLRQAGYEVRIQEDWEKWGVTYSKDDERRFSIHYDVRKRNQMHYCLRLNQFKAFWERYNTLDMNARRMLVEMTNACSDCGNCKKIGIKSMGPFTAQIDGETRRLCPWYPRSEWRYVDAGLIEGVRTLLDIQEEILHEED